MKLVTTISALRDEIRVARSRGLKVGFVPTMGALHPGHLSLFRLAREHTDYVVVSIYVNPIQFNNPQDLQAYPRMLDRDIASCDGVGVDLVYAPTDQEFYPRGWETTQLPGKTARVSAGDRALGYCGATRPGHFDGVVTVVASLFNQVQPDVSVFGEKDYQQAQVIKQMVEDLHFPVRIILGPTVREADGLALSSRNLRLGAEDRALARVIPQTLNWAVRMVQEGERDALKLCAQVSERLCCSERIAVDYVAIADSRSLTPLTEITIAARLLAAVFVADVRLIDNVSLQIR